MSLTPRETVERELEWAAQEGFLVRQDGRSLYYQDPHDLTWHRLVRLWSPLRDGEGPELKPASPFMNPAWLTASNRAIYDTTINTNIWTTGNDGTNT